MILRVRDANLTDEAADLVWERKKKLEKDNGHCPMNRGIVVNIILKEHSKALQYLQKLLDMSDTADFAKNEETDELFYREVSGFLNQNKI